MDLFCVSHPEPSKSFIRPLFRTPNRSFKPTRSNTNAVRGYCLVLIRYLYGGNQNGCFYTKLYYLSHVLGIGFLFELTFMSYTFLTSKDNKYLFRHSVYTIRQASTTYILQNTTRSINFRSVSTAAATAPMLLIAAMDNQYPRNSNDPRVFEP
ncbi:hypothetical protein BDZ94DRAFT_610749 [Collybia nuda]|uniref:Uncharacterized protein n=1 Tax=Collybia nuda TaxID=64659 RepID=A0A9P6CF06_9AGAR|nr:hypothetical protein BDZ94DRAFT_610749 [Collybia nuda]